jgi:chromosomal replication initiator protein
MNNSTDRQDKLTPSEAWRATLGELELQLAKSTFDAWLKGTTVVACEDGVFTIGARNSYSRDWLENRLQGPIKRTLCRIVDRQVDVRFIVDAKPVATLMPEDLIGCAPPKDKTNGHSACLNPRYTFDAFVPGSSNRMPFEISRVVSERPAEDYNPLFLYGGVGLGKTHLLHAIGHSAIQRGLKVLYITAEQFTNDLVNAIRTRATEEFRARYRSADVLLVDDIQFIAGKDSSQEEFLHTFNALYDANCQIVLSSNLPPKSIAALDERLRSRFEGGLLAPIQPPDYDTRVDILKARATARGLFLDEDVLDFICQAVQNNIRELEGALNRVAAHCEAMRQPATLETVQCILEDLICSEDRLSPQSIVAAAASHFGLQTEALIGPSRKKEVSLARQICMYLLCTETDLALQQVGALLGNRDHTTILHGRDKVRELMGSDAMIRLQILAIKERASVPVAAH